MARALVVNTDNPQNIYPHFWKTNWEELSETTAHLPYIIRNNQMTPEDRLQFCYEQTLRWALGMEVTFPDEGEWKRDEEAMLQK